MDIIAKIEEINQIVHDFVWGPPMLVLLIFTGIYLTFRTKFFQVTRFGHVLKTTIFAIFKDKNVVKTKDSKAISQFQALATALASTVGTGNIAGVATAIVSGGPGAVFWMWVSAFFGMMTCYAENVLGIFYRHKNKDGEWVGGPMVYIEKGLGQKWLAVIFSVFCLFASFGIGNIAQINSISTALNSSLGIPLLATGIVLALVVGFILLGGLKRLASVTEKLVPLMSGFYLLGTVIIIATNYQYIGNAFSLIFTQAFSLDAVLGGAAGTIMANAIRYGLARGVFSNEAGLGSSVMVHSSSDVKEPAIQGAWGIFQVFFDTIIICTLTALTILTSNVYLSNVGGNTGAALTMAVFTEQFGFFGSIFMSVAILLFAFSTILGWSFYGQRAVEYIWGTKFVPVYKAIFTVVVLVGAMSSVQLVWDLSDTFNGLMAVPNLIGVLCLSPVVIKVTKNYVDRVFKSKDIEPIVSFEDEKRK